MAFADSYLEKQKGFQVKINAKPSPGLKFIVVIPCFNEPNLLRTLDSLKKCEKITSSVEIIVVINSSELSGKEILSQNIKTLKETKDWIRLNEAPSFRFFILHEKGLPRKFAGAGLARKIGMDQAIARFNQLDKHDGVIVSMDADSTVKRNYFTELEKHFSKYPKTNAVTMYFEHPCQGTEFDEGIYNAISIYELYLRYYKLALAFTGFPYSKYTIGSCFAVNTNAYVKQGGMNRKQAGEDFYFLHKIFPLGNTYEINTSCVYPSPRISNRVPFGTGPMVKSISENKDEVFLTYNFEAFKELKLFFSLTEDFFRIKEVKLTGILGGLPACISSFLKENGIEAALQEINQNSSNIKSFIKRFYNWFDAFRVLKFLNFAHEKFYNKKPLLEEVKLLGAEIMVFNPAQNDYKVYLEIFRSFERQF